MANEGSMQWAAKHFKINKLAPAAGGIDPITPSDATVYTPEIRTLQCTQDATVALVLVSGDAITWQLIADVESAAMMISKVMLTGTTLNGGILRGLQ